MSLLTEFLSVEAVHSSRHAAGLWTTAAVEELGGAGHGLWCWDASEEGEVWSHHDVTRRPGAGLYLHCSDEDGVSVELCPPR